MPYQDQLVPTDVLPEVEITLHRNDQESEEEEERNKGANDAPKDARNVQGKMKGRA